MARNRQTAWRVEGYRQEIRDHGGLLAETRGQEGTAFPDRRVFRHGGFVAVRGRAHAPQAAPYRQTRVRQARRGGGLRGLVLVGAALREEVARGASVRRRRLSRARLERRRHAGRFRRGRRHDRRGDVKVHCLVATFPHSNMRYVAAMPGENAECVCEGLAQIFDHIGMVPRVLVLDNATGAGHRVAWNKVTVVRVFAMFCDHYRLETRFRDPVFRQREGIRRERGRLPAPQPHGPQAQRGEPRAAGEASAVEVRRDRGRGPATVPAGRYASCSTWTAGRCSRCRARVSTRSNGSSARPTRRATSRSARSVTSRARHGAAGRCSRACARSRWGSAPPTAGT